MAQPRSTVPSSEWRHRAWLAALVLAVSAFSLAFACATPFAAFAAMAALTVSRGDALRLTLTLWLLDQAIGFGIHGYAPTGNALGWGAAMGAAALLATVAAWAIASRAPSQPTVRTALAFAGAFAVYEAALLAVAVAGLGGVENFAPRIVAEILFVNLVALVGLAVLNRVGELTGLAPRPVLA